MRHEDVWRALDTLAAEKGLSPSGLARAAGLDPTAFNRSKRATAHGRLRWPSTESLSRVLAATGASLETFTALVSGAPRALAGLRPSWRGLERQGPAARRLPQMAFSSLTGGEDPADSGEETASPIVADPGSYAIRLDSPAFEPVLREGALLIASPEVPVRSGDRVILREANGAIRAGIVSLAPADTIALESFGQASAIALPRGAIGWMHRIGWASL